MTLETHLTSVIDDRTYFGLVLGYRPPGDEGAFCDVATCRVLDADNAEELVDTLAITSDAVEALSLMEAIVANPTPVVAVSATIADRSLGERIRSAPTNPAVLLSLDRLCDDLVDPDFRRAMRRIVARG